MRNRHKPWKDTPQTPAPLVLSAACFADANVAATRGAAVKAVIRRINKS